MRGGCLLARLLVAVLTTAAGAEAHGGTLSGCGVVVVWTKAHFGGVSVRDPRRP